MKIIVNKTDKDGLLLCPACGKGSIWPEGDRFRTSPMQRFMLPGKIDALVHQSCIARLLAQARRKA